MKLWKIFVVVLLPTQFLFAAKTYYVAPAKHGNGDALSAVNAASYCSYTGFWNGKVKPALNSESVTVWFVEGLGNYSIARLNLSDIGNANNRLYLRGQKNGSGVWFNLANDESNPILDLHGACNVSVYDLNFTGSTCKEMAIALDEANDIEINSCCFDEMRDAEYCAIWVCYGAHDIQITNNWISRIGKDYRAHGIYNRADSYNIDIVGNHFKDIAGAYISIRDNVSYVTVEDNIFESSGTYYWQEDGNEVGEDTYVAITIHNSNWEETDEEVFGDYYTIVDNNFTYASASMLDTAVQWSHKGYPIPHDTGGQIPDEDEVSDLISGGPASKLSFLSSAGIDLGNVYFSGNIYGPNVTKRVGYSWLSKEPGAVWTYTDASDAFYQARFGYDWELSGDLGEWSYTTYSGTSVGRYYGNPAHGTYYAGLVDSSTANAVDLYKSVGDDIPHGYYRTWVRIPSTAATAYPIYTNVGSAGGAIHWIKANTNHTWGNNNTSFGSWSDNTWYFLEMVFDFATDKYTVWLNNSKIADDITIPTSTTTPRNDYMSGNLKIRPSSSAGTGTMYIDFNKLGVYED